MITVGNVLFYGGAVVSMCAAVWLTSFFFPRAYNDRVFRALTVYFAGAALVNALVLVRSVAPWWEWIAGVRFLHAAVLCYLVYALRRGNKR